MISYQCDEKAPPKRNSWTGHKEMNHLRQNKGCGYIEHCLTLHPSDRQPRFVLPVTSCVCTVMPLLREERSLYLFTSSNA